ncbi:MAG: hypothetical protein HZB51_11940 [Chloroflexi bacterium]|nr:hypothetical protein [Chloroflexota bacterium]
MEKNDVLTAAQRRSQLLLIGAMLFVGGFFAYHQLSNTGFFTFKFGPLEMLALYGPIAVSLAAPIIRALSGHRNPASLFDTATRLLLAIGSLELVLVFPLDFAHIADVLPGAIRFILSWMTNDFGRLVLLLQVILGCVTAVAAIFKYLSTPRGRHNNLSLP